MITHHINNPSFKYELWLTDNYCIHTNKEFTKEQIKNIKEMFGFEVKELKNERN